MSKTRWAVEGAEGTIVEVNGRKFASQDDGAPMLVTEFSMHLHLPSLIPLLVFHVLSGNGSPRPHCRVSIPEREGML